MTPPIRELKQSAGFTGGALGKAVYRTWRKAARRELEAREIISTSDPGRAQWAELAAWALTRVPLSQRSALFGGTSAEAVEFTAAVNGLLQDVLKKLNHSRSGQVNLDPPQPPVVPVQGLSPFPFVSSNRILITDAYRLAVPGRTQTCCPDLVP